MSGRRLPGLLDYLGQIIELDDGIRAQRAAKGRVGFPGKNPPVSLGKIFVHLSPLNLVTLLV